MRPPILVLTGFVDLQYEALLFVGGLGFRVIGSGRLGSVKIQTLTYSGRVFYCKEVGMPADIIN